MRELNETLERCRVLFLERTELVRTRQRTGWISVALNPLYSTRPPSTAEMRSLAALAFAGWCWRAAENGEPARLAAAIRRAHAVVQADPSVPQGYELAWTAQRFLADGGEPGLASPGDTDRARTDFLDAAFIKMHETYGAPAEIDEERSRAAFNHGVALRDVERIINYIEPPLPPFSPEA